MAKREVFIDDLTGAVYDEGEGRTVRIAVDDESTAVDLTNDNINELKRLLSPYFQKSTQRTTNGNSRPMIAPRVAETREGMQAIRKWAKKNNYKVSERGRIPYAVMDAYTKAHMLTGAGR